MAATFTFDPPHTWVGDLAAKLIPPGGGTAILFDRPGTSTFQPGDNSNVVGPYTFSDTAPENPTFAAAAATVDTNGAVPSGSYRASFSDNAPALITDVVRQSSTLNGVWTLRFSDHCQGNTGSVSSASLTIDFEGQPGTAPTGTTGATGQIGPTGQRAAALAKCKKKKSKKARKRCRARAMTLPV